jgi:hypothetical protein
MQYSHPDNGSDGNSGFDWDNPVKSLGVAYTNGRLINGVYRGRMMAGPGDYDFEDWPVVDFESVLHIEGWGVGKFDDPGQNLGTQIIRPDTVASDGQPWARPQPYGSRSPAREFWNHRTSFKHLYFSGGFTGSEVNLTTAAPAIVYENGGLMCHVEDLNCGRMDDAYMIRGDGGLETLRITGCDTNFGGLFEGLDGTNPHSGSYYPNGVAVHGPAQLDSGSGGPNAAIRLVGNGFSPNDRFYMAGFTLEGLKYGVQHEVGASGHLGWGVTLISGGAFSMQAASRMFYETAGLGQSARLYAINCGGPAEFYESLDQTQVGTWGTGGGESRHPMKFSMAHGRAAPLFELDS